MHADLVWEKSDLKSDFDHKTLGFSSAATDFRPGKHAKICISFQLIVRSQVQGPPGGPNSTQFGVVAAKLQPSECWSPSAMFDMQPQHDLCSKSGSDGLVGKLMLLTFKHKSGVAAIGCCINMLSCHQHAKKMHVHGAHSSCQVLVTQLPTLSSELM